MIDAIGFKFQTGSHESTCRRCMATGGASMTGCGWMRAINGTWERVFSALVAQADADEDLNWAVSVDSTIVRAHQHAAGARK
ncbi:hypothetical protein [Streptomyces sp900116325]|uniref:hypothetical protein n=1 Tax=Streptomyces sp. 900116325 TaxID=3154295 RepID=UPI0033B3E049